jgi:leukotriene A-4 hydrolase/aminopeptidase
MSRLDPHSYFDTEQPRARHLRLDWLVDFEAHRIAGTATLELEAPGSGPLDLDSKDLEIESVVDQRGNAVPFELGEPDDILGRRLRLVLPDGTTAVTIRYRTSSVAIALQWFAPEQTAGKRHPFMYSQCQAIHARTIVPVQDTPRVRVSYSAAVTVPEALSVVMSAGPAGERAGAQSGMRTFLFEMPQPIPPYLLAIAAGDLASRDLSPRSRVWAEPETVESAAYEFAEVEQMITTAESIFGPYDWDRFDMLVLPPAFPYGGMENPRMTFLTPTVIAGDRSLVDVVAHELAHSWTGNLVTNADAEHFWLNEGFTTWAERRIFEAMHGSDEVVLSWAMGQRALEESVERFGAGSPLTKLRQNLAGVDPDESFSSVPYEKGARFVTAIEQAVGRPRFDEFMRAYMKHFLFQSITSEEFIAFLDTQIPGLSEKVDAKAWLYETGLPANAPVFRSAKLDELSALAKGWQEGKRPTAEQMKSWHTAELLVYLQQLPRQLDAQSLAWLDERLSLTARGNYEILVEWLTIAAASDYEPVFDRVREVLLTVGRMKYLRPLYKALGAHPRTQKLAREIYEAGKHAYHSLSRHVIESEMEKY